MSDSAMLNRYASITSRTKPSAGTMMERTDAPEPEALADAADDLGCFGHLRGQRDRAVMLELRRRTGDVLAIAYGYVDRIAFDPSEGITIHAGGQTVRIRGTNLNGEVRPNVRLFEGLTRHRVTWVSQRSSGREGHDDRRTTVDSIDW